MVGQISTGAARAEQREPSHDGEYISIYYVGGDGRYIAADNSGVAWTSETETDFVGEAEDASLAAELVEEARDLVAAGEGDTATYPLGSEAAELAAAWGWELPAW